MRTLASLAKGVPDDGAAGVESQDRRLPTLIQALVQSPPAGIVALLRGSNIVLSLATFAAGLYALKGQRVLLIDAGNSTDPYIVSRLALAARRDPQPVLSRIHIIRTFTVHQLAGLAFRRLEPFIQKRAPGLVIFAGATSLFADANVPLKEANLLLRKIATEIKQQAEQGCKVLVTAADAPVESGRRNLHVPWLDVASRSMRVQRTEYDLVLRREKPLSGRVEIIPANAFLPFVR